MFTATFKDVSTANTFNINGIQIYNTDGTVYDVNNRILLQKMDGEGYYLDPAYNYRSTKGGWCNKANLVTDITLRSGEAVCLNNGSGAAKKIRVSGQVELNPISFTLPTGFTLMGNMTPATINMNDITVYYKPDGSSEWEIYPTNNRVTLQKMDSEGYYLDPAYNYRSTKNGWCNKANLVTDVEFAPGEAFCINNGTGSEIQLRYKSPVSSQQ